MKIVIVGAGKVGEHLCSDLSKDHDIILIEKDPEVLDNMLNNNDIAGIVGNGASYPILLEAGVGDADVFISVTPKDELNIISSVIAKKLGAKNIIARVRNPEYSGYMEFVRESLGIDLMLNPEYEAARSIVDHLKFPSAISVETFAKQRASMVELPVKKGSYLDGMKLMDFPKKCPNRVLIAIVERGDEIYIPDGNFVLKAGDKIHVTGTNDNLISFYGSVGEKNRGVRSIIIIGGGKLTYYILKIIAKQNLEIKVIEADRERARQLSEFFPNVIFIHDDGTSRETLEEENFKDYDACIALTGIDEENIIISMYGQMVGVPKVIAKVSRTELLDIVDPERLQTVITPKQIAADIITRIVRSMVSDESSNVLNLYRLLDNRVEASEFLVKETSQVIDIPLRDLDTKEGVLITYIMRGNDLIFPDGNESIKEGDHVIIVSKQSIEDIDQILN